MKCAETINVGPLLDGEMNEHEGALLRAHLGECDQCTSEFDRLSDLTALARSVDHVEVPSRLETQLLADLRRTYPRRRAWLLQGIPGPRLTVPAPILAGILLLLGLGYWGVYRVGASMAGETVIVKEVPVHITQQDSGPQNEPAVISQAPVQRTRVITRVVNTCSESDRTHRQYPTVPLSGDLPVLTATSTKDGFLTDLKLDGFRPPEAITATVIKGVKANDR